MIPLPNPSIVKQDISELPMGISGFSRTLLLPYKKPLPNLQESEFFEPIEGMLKLRDSALKTVQES